jgi:hypothetical protein
LLLFNVERRACRVIIVVIIIIIEVSILSVNCQDLSDLVVGMIVIEHFGPNIFPGPSEFIFCQLSHSHYRYLELAVVFGILDPNLLALFQQHLCLPLPIQNFSRHLVSEALECTQVVTKRFQACLYGFLFVFRFQHEGLMIGSLVEGGGQVVLEVLLEGQEFGGERVEGARGGGQF